MRCPDCFEKFRTARALRGHVNREHPGPRPAHARTTQGETLVTASRTTDRAPYTRPRPPRIVCSLCQRPFQTKQACQEHIRNYHADEVERLRQSLRPTSKEDGMQVIKK